MATVAQIKDKVLAHQFNASRYSDLIVDFIDEGQKWLARQTDFTELEEFHLFDLEAGVGSESPSNFTDFMRIDTLVDRTTSSDHFDLTHLYRAEFDQLDSETTGIPIYYYIGIGNLSVRPKPNKTRSYLLRYYKNPDTLSITDTPEIPEEYHRLLEEYALIRTYEMEHDHEAAQYHQTRLDFDVQKMRGEVQYETIAQTKQVPGMWRDIG